MVRPASPVAAPSVVASAGADDGGPGVRLRRLRRRRRLLREELLAVAFLVIALAATLAVLGLEWLGSGPSANSAVVGAPAQIYGGPT
jgi:hypothetical protein